MSNKTFKIDRVIERLMMRIEDDQIIDVGRNAALYFGVSPSTLSKAVKEIANSGGAKIFYLPVKQKGGEGKTTTVKVLAPRKWEFVPLMKQTDKIVKLQKGARSIKKEITELGKDANTIRALVDDPKKRDALNSLDAPKSMLNHRIRQLKRQGMSNVRIGAVLDIHESTVRRRLKMPMGPIEILLDEILYDLEDAREKILQKYVDHPEFHKVFGDGFGEQYILSIHTNRRQVEISPKLKRTKFTLEFIATVKDVK